jgi:hypothetical protein
VASQPKATGEPMADPASANWFYLHRGDLLVASIPSCRPSHLAFVGVYPLGMPDQWTQRFLRNHGHAVPVPKVREYRIRRFEVDRIYIEQDLWIGESELEKPANWVAYGDDGLAEILSQSGVRIEELEQPYKSDHPI